MYFKLFYRVEAKGKEHIPKNGAAIFCANHIDVRDPMLLAISIKRQVHFIAKKELFKVKFFAYFLTKLGIIPVDRENPSMSVYKRAIQLLKDKKTLGLFAQGSRMSTIEANESKAGVALFAVKGDACVVPVHISATYKWLSKVYITFGEPIFLDEYKDKRVKTETLNEITERIMSKVAELGRDL